MAIQILLESILPCNGFLKKKYFLSSCSYFVLSCFLCISKIIVINYQLIRGIFCRTCIRLSNLVRDKTLWENVDFRPHIITLRNLKKFIKFFQTSTKFIATRGPCDSSVQLALPSISKSFLRGVAKNCPNLETLILEDHLLDSSKVRCV